MIDLVLDSSDKELLVGIFSNEYKDVISYPCWQRQSEMLVYEIDKLLNKHNLDRSDIGSVIVSKGPGSYTGIRIALTVAKVISFALHIPMYVGSSLEILRNRNKKCLVVSNARSKRSYCAIYDKDEVLLKDCIKENNEVLEILKKDNDLLLCGDTSYLGMEGYK
ncbi:MAG TPA: tRNA (adenosine(37)-N6)-threonylcarbamoyltransferase complex dimerization subunit type 1 TsaB, partial [Firmicutes bacterium]|nr:tRNA (adenosine(37)-N6)-threonylcarbamoyltransferase complex dimerization subunit type 1 TsaB [Bacillota bacterium]